MHPVVEAPMPSIRRVLATIVALAACTPAAAQAQSQYFDVGKLPLPAVTGKEIADSIQSFTDAYPQRVTGTLNELNAAMNLRDEATKLGYQTSIIELPLASGLPPAVTHVVLATRPGRTKPNEHLVFIAHYDVVPQTINGSYDDGSGTMMLRALARAFATVPTNRTLDFAWYNGEEEGLLSSDPHAQSFADAGKVVRAAMGFDMVGIAYPVANVTDKSCLCMWHGEDDERFVPLLRHVNFDVLGFPDKENLVEIRGVNARNSDESSWDKRGFPTLRWAGMRAAADYPAYHMPDDTMATIDSVAGGRNYFEQGLHNILLSSYLTTLTLDNDSPVAQATATGRGPVSFNATGSSDPDGAIGPVTWSFGDGKTATGATASHAYKRRGTYTVTVSVGDNLWPQVSTSKELSVRVTKVKKRKHKRRAR
jgi:hypothetical protein